MRESLYTCSPHTVYQFKNTPIDVCRDEPAISERIEALAAPRAPSKMFTISMQPHIVLFARESIVSCSFRRKNVFFWDSISCSSAWHTLFSSRIFSNAPFRLNFSLHFSSSGAFNNAAIDTRDLTRETSNICSSSLASSVFRLEQTNFRADYGLWILV